MRLIAQILLTTFLLQTFLPSGYSEVESAEAVPVDAAGDSKSAEATPAPASQNVEPATETVQSTDESPRDTEEKPTEKSETADESAAEVVAEEPPPPTKGMDEIVSLEFRSTEASDVLRYLAQKAGLNISISTKVSGRVSIMVNNVPIRDIFDIVLRSNALAYEKQGEVYHIMTEAEYKELYGEKFSDLRQVKALRLQYASPEQAFNMLDTIKSSIGRLLIDQKSGTVLLMDTKEKIKEMEEALSVLESNEAVKIFDLRYAKAADVEAKLKDEFETNKLGTIHSDERTNQLIIRALPNRMTEVERVIESLDRKTREVLIDAKILKITLSNDFDSGIDWDQIFTNTKFHGLDKSGDFRAETNSETAGEEVPAVFRLQPGPWFRTEDDPSGFNANTAGELVFTTINRDGYELFRYLRTLGHTKIISKPRILVVENQEAKIHVGTKEAYVTSTTTSGTSTATTADKIEFLDVGIQFVVKPRITDNGYVEIALKPEISSVSRTITTSSGSRVPIIDTSTADTKVLVKDGSTVVIGGLRKHENVRDDDEVPYLNKVPLLGKALFSKQSKDDEITEIVIFVTPHIVTGDKFVSGDEDEFGGAFKPYRDYDSAVNAPQGIAKI